MELTARGPPLMYIKAQEQDRYLSIELDIIFGICVCAIRRSIIGPTLESLPYWVPKTIVIEVVIQLNSSYIMCMYT